jgi:hypothetical protein
VPAESGKFKVYPFKLAMKVAHVRFQGQSGHHLLQEYAFAVAIDEADMSSCVANVGL